MWRHIYCLGLETVGVVASFPQVLANKYAYPHCGCVGLETVQHHFRRKSKHYTECNEKDHLILGQFQAPQATNAQFNIPANDCTQEKPIKVSQVWNSFWLVMHLTLIAESTSLRLRQPQLIAKFVIIVYGNKEESPIHSPSERTCK